MNTPAPADLSAEIKELAIVIRCLDPQCDAEAEIGEIVFRLGLLGYRRLAADEVVCKREMLTEAAKYMESAADYIPGDFPARTAVTNRAQELRAKAGEGFVSGSANATSGDR